MAKSRTNVIPIIEDARHPLKYRMLMGMVDVIFADVAQPDQVTKLDDKLFIDHTSFCVLHLEYDVFSFAFIIITCMMVVKLLCRLLFPMKIIFSKSYRSDFILLFISTTDFLHLYIHVIHICRLFLREKFYNNSISPFFLHFFPFLPKTFIGSYCCP